MTEKGVTVVAGCVLTQDGRFLLVQEKQKKAHELWNLPAGHVDKDEAIETAAVRETFEETGYKVELDRELPVEHNAPMGPVAHAFKAHIIGGSLSYPSAELLDARWLTLEEVKQLQNEGKLRNIWVLNSILESLQ